MQVVLPVTQSRRPAPQLPPWGAPTQTWVWPPRALRAPVSLLTQADPGVGAQAPGVSALGRLLPRNMPGLRCSSPRCQSPRGNHLWSGTPRLARPGPRGPSPTAGLSPHSSARRCPPPRGTCGDSPCPRSGRSTETGCSGPPPPSPWRCRSRTSSSGGRRDGCSRPPVPPGGRRTPQTPEML